MTYPYKSFHSDNIYKSSRAILSDGSSGSFHQVSIDSVGTFLVAGMVNGTNVSGALKGITLHVDGSVGGGDGSGGETVSS